MHYTASNMREEHHLLLSAIGLAVRSLREQRGITRRGLASRSGVSWAVTTARVVASPTAAAS